MSMKYTIFVPHLTPWEPRRKWCAENIGTKGVDWDVLIRDSMYATDHVEYVFENEQLAMLFALKWVGVK